MVHSQIIVLLVSRGFLLERLFKRLNEMKSKNPTSILILVDGDLNLFLKVRNLSTGLNREKLCVRSETVKPPSRSQHYRRKRIAELHNEAKQYIQESDYIILLEDDGLPPKDLLTRLEDAYEKYPDAGFISGLEMGRWITPYIGGWIVDDPNDPSELESVTIEKPIQEVHAAGFYAMITKRELYEQHDFKPHRNYGPDLVYGFKLSAMGYTNYMLTDLVIDHYTETKVINPDTTPIRKTHMKKVKGIWRFVHVVQK